MAKTIKIRVTHPKNEKFHPVLRKPVALRPVTLLVHDPRGSCVEGDVVNVQGGFRASKTVHHMVTRIVAPFGGLSVTERPPVLTPEERRNWRGDKTRAKQERREARRAEKEEEEDRDKDGGSSGQDREGGEPGSVGEQGASIS